MYVYFCVLNLFISQGRLITEFYWIMMISYKEILEKQQITLFVASLYVCIFLRFKFIY